MIMGELRGWLASASYSNCFYVSKNLLLNLDWFRFFDAVYVY